MRRFIYTFIIALIFAATGVSAEEEKLNGNCTLSFKGRIYSQGSCEAIMMDNSITVKGVVPELGATYLAIIDEKASTGVLLGADVFVLADGPIERTSRGALYYWSNGYALDFHIAKNN